jgi:hypothetical protein
VIIHPKPRNLCPNPKLKKVPQIQNLKTYIPKTLPKTQNLKASIEKTLPQTLTLKIDQNPKP